jgi:G3E family GTPase
MSIAVDIFSGFLGAGKTMLIKKMIAEAVYEKELAIIENEFGEVAIDGAYLEESCMQIKEIYSGCICCSVAGNFKEAIEELMKSYELKRIIIEPSGVASLSDVLKVFKDNTFKDKVKIDRVITVADASRFEMYKNNFTAFYKNQIEYAKTIVFSRTQALDAKQIEKLVSEVRGINKTAAIVTTPWDQLDAKVIAEAREEAIKEELVRKVSQNRRSIKSVAGLVHNAQAAEVFDSVGIEPFMIQDEKRLKYMLDSLKNESAYGEVLRAKGIVCAAKGRWLQFDYVAGEYELRESRPYYTGKACIIGAKLKKQALEQLFKG